MAANATDLRYFYAETIGPTALVIGAAGSATPLSEALEPGRYILRVVDFGGGTGVWVRQGPFGTLPDAAAGAPNMLFTASTDAAVLNRPLITFMVHGGNLENPSQDNGLSFFVVGGTGALIQVTKVSRGKG